MGIPSWWPRFGWQVWLIAIGRFLSQAGTGLTLFYATIFFVNRVGLTATQVGLGSGIMGLTGVFGRIFAGSLTDGVWGRKVTLMVSLAISALGSFGLALADTFWAFALANGAVGLGQGLYWPAAEAMVADLASREQRNEAYALNRLADNLGNSLGVALASGWVALTGAYRWLFVLDGVSFLIFLVLLWGWVRETRLPKPAGQPILTGWKTALRDPSLLVFGLANILFTAYIAQLSSSLPLYLRNGVGIPEAQIGALFAIHGAVVSLLQIPVARWLNRLTRIQGLQGSALMWGIGFGLVWLSSMVGRWGSAAAFSSSMLALLVLSLAVVLYNPSASALVVDLAPEDARGVYLSINSLCWAVGFALGPAAAGMVLDLPPPWPASLWMVWVATVALVWGILSWLQAILPARVNAAVWKHPKPLLSLGSTQKQ